MGRTLCTGLCPINDSRKGRINISMVLVIKSPPANAGDLREKGSVPGWGKCPGGGHGPTPVFLPGESMGREAWWATQSMGLQRVRHE